MLQAVSQHVSDVLCLAWMLTSRSISVMHSAWTKTLAVCKSVRVCLKATVDELNMADLEGNSSDGL